MSASSDPGLRHVTPQGIAVAGARVFVTEFAIDYAARASFYARIVSLPIPRSAAGWRTADSLGRASGGLQEPVGVAALRDRVFIADTLLPGVVRMSVALDGTDWLVTAVPTE
ncbi:MAG: hypothetical protein WCH74_10965 [Chloroflexota bacterium]